VSTQALVTVIKAAFTVTRDLVLLGLGVFGILHQELTGHVSPELLLVYSGLLGTPGAIGLVTLLRGKAEIPATASSSQASQAQQASRE
jgi:hypothetical protein